jgi:hypothetical protein
VARLARHHAGNACDTRDTARSQCAATGAKNTCDMVRMASEGIGLDDGAGTTTYVRARHGDVVCKAQSTVGRGLADVCMQR